MPNSDSELAAWDRRHVWHGFTQMAGYDPLIIEQAEGCRLTDIDGNTYIDGVSSLWCNVHGHRHPRLDAAVRDQLGRVAHVTNLGLSHPATIRLARRLAERTPGDLDHIFFSDDGSTSVEVALKMVIQYWRQCEEPQPRKKTFVSFGGAYHGDTIGSVSVGGVPQFHAVFDPLLFNVIRLPSPDTYRLPEGVTASSACSHYLAQVESVLAASHEEIAAVVIEPLVQGAAGLIMHPTGFLSGVRQLTTKYKVLLIADEVAVGMGRTGTMFACERESVVPDLLCLAKGLTGGYMPLAATIATTGIWNAFLGDYAESKTFFHGHTFGGNPLGAAVAIASLDVFEEEKTLDHLPAKIDRMAGHLKQIAEHPHVGDVRQCGMIAAVELVQDKATKQPYAWEEQRGALACRRALGEGVWLRPLGNVIVIMPALAISLEEIDQIFRAIKIGVEAVT